MRRMPSNTEWLISLATAAWDVWIWTAECERDRGKERARVAALYVEPFLFDKKEGYDPFRAERKKSGTSTRPRTVADKKPYLSLSDERVDGELIENAS